MDGRKCKSHGLKKYHEEILSDSWIEKKAKHLTGYDNIRKKSSNFIKKNIMKKLIISWLLHHANRYTKSESFYEIKDNILTKYGQQIGYDIQKLPGKPCNSCGGTGNHPKYSNKPPYEVYDWSDCYKCWNGWYRLPAWVLLARIKFGRYVFHKPIKRENVEENPFTEELGYNVSKCTVIKGYINHERSIFSRFSFMFIFYLYKRWMFYVLWVNYKQDLKQNIRFKIRNIKRLFGWETIIIIKPIWNHYIDYLGNVHEIDHDLPF